MGAPAKGANATGVEHPAAMSASIQAESAASLAAFVLTGVATAQLLDIVVQLERVA
jgi:hypothetical protein